LDTIVDHQVFSGGREQVRRQTVAHALSRVLAL
jgi:nicotinamide mononucleotide (NMN) deamidase PncC